MRDVGSVQRPDEQRRRRPQPRLQSPDGVRERPRVVVVDDLDTVTADDGLDVPLERREPRGVPGRLDHRRPVGVLRRLRTTRAGSPTAPSKARAAARSRRARPNGRAARARTRASSRPASCRRGRRGTGARSSCRCPARADRCRSPPRPRRGYSRECQCRRLLDSPRGLGEDQSPCRACQGEATATPSRGVATSAQERDDLARLPTGRTTAASQCHRGAAATARASNAAAARRGLWDALATTECGQPDVVRGFFESLPPDRHIVDVGCWNGAIAALGAASIAGGDHRQDHARAPWRSYLGVDVVPEAVAEFRNAHRLRPRTRAVEGDIRALPLADASSDVVLCLFVLQDMRHRADGLQALGELARVARPGASSSSGSPSTRRVRRRRSTSSRSSGVRGSRRSRRITGDAPTSSRRSVSRLPNHAFDEFGPNDARLRRAVRSRREGRPRARSPGNRTIPVGSSREPPSCSSTTSATSNA